MNIGGYKAIEHALNNGDSNSLCLEVILVHMPFVLKSSIVDEILVDKNNLPLYVCFETTLWYVRHFLLNEEHKANFVVKYWQYTLVMEGKKAL